MKLTKNSLLVLTKMGQGITADLILRKKAMYDVNMNLLPGEKLVLQFVEKDVINVQKQLEIVEKISNSVAETHMKVVRRRKKDPQKIKQQTLNDDAQKKSECYF